jgi:2-oxo-3-hexenedioate decarboxylase
MDPLALSPTLQKAYADAAVQMKRRVEQGDTVIGMKVGFSNSSIWPLYNVDGPIFGAMYQSTVHDLSAESTCSVAQLSLPRIEPEIAFRLSRLPQASMTEAELLGCTSHFAHGFEIVQSQFADWKFTAEQAVAAGSLHGKLYLGPWQRTPQSPHALKTLAAQLANFSVRLLKKQSGQQDAVEIEKAPSTRVLSNPVNSLGYLAQAMQRCDFPRALQVGDIVLTGTITNAYPVEAGDVWSTDVLNLTWPNDWFALEKVTGIELAFVG